MQEPEELLESLTLVSARPEWKSSFSEKLRKRERTPNWLARFLLGLTVLVGGSYAWQQVQYARLGWNAEVPKVTPAPERPQLFPLILADQRDELKRQLGQNPALLEKTGLRDLTPLHYALLLGRFECAQILLEQGASLEARDAATTRNVLRDALALAPSLFVEKLAAHEKLDFTNPDESLESAWSWLWWKNPSYFQILLRSRPPFDWRDPTAQDLWKQIAARGNPEVVEQMVNLGAPLDQVGGQSPLALAYARGNKPAVYRLLSLGADPRTGQPNLLSQASSMAEKKAFARAAELAACRENIALLSRQLEQWASVHGDRYPVRLDQLPGQIPACPNAPGSGYRYRGLGGNYQLNCPGHHVGLPTGQPAFSPLNGLVPQKLNFEPPQP
ncbi:MAG: hypothetical protein U0931_37575 [Vulcanimicrobiota bacterium]